MVRGWVMVIQDSGLLIMTLIRDTASRLLAWAAHLGSGLTLIPTRSTSHETLIILAAGIRAR
jgi:hypothetical protein